METAERRGVRRLPAGPHGIPAELVARNQRERLIAAIAEVCAERGYAETSVAEVTRRAGVSTVTFYRLFADKRDCMLAAHQALLERLLEEVDRTGEARAALRTVLALFAADAPTARLLCVEILAVGAEGMRRHDAAVAALAARLRGAADGLGGAPSPPSPPTHADWAVVAGVLALIGRQVMAGKASRLPELEDELVATLSAQSRG